MTPSMSATILSIQISVITISTWRSSIGANESIDFAPNMPLAYIIVHYAGHD